MNELSRRHDLKAARPVILRELNHRYTHQKKHLSILIWLTSGLIALTVIGIIIGRLIHLQKIGKLRERFAADLHDELGANLHTIGLLSDAALSARDSEEDWKVLHQRIRSLSGRTGTAIKNFSTIATDDGLYFGLVKDMQRATERIMAQFEHTLEIEGDAFLSGLKPRMRVDLFLFYKECLVNICRHSNATRFDAKLNATLRTITLTVKDNGDGLPNKKIPTSLKRRARMLKGKLTGEEIYDGGTVITLQIRTPKTLKESNE